MKKVISTCLSVLMISSVINADSEDTATEVINQTLQSIEVPSDSPDWMKRTSLKLRVEKGFKPTYEFETVQPIYQISTDDMIFWQFNSTYRDHIDTHNLGLGYRNIINSNLMLGINSFYDYQADNKHKRWSIGAEAIGNYLEFRANRYMAISKKKEVSTGVFEEVLDGWDTEIGALIPSTDLKVFLAYSKWDAKNTLDLEQKSISVEYPINNYIVFDLQYTSDSQKQGSLDKSRVLARLSISFGPKSKSSKNLITSEDLHDRLLIPVKRENEIIVEKTISSTITIGRGT